MTWRTIGGLAIAHVIASYGCMAALDVLSFELDRHVYPGLIWRTAAAPAGAPWTVIEIASGASPLKPLAAVIIVAVYGVMFFGLVLWRLARRRETPRGFPVLPASAGGAESPR